MTDDMEERVVDTIIEKAFEFKVQRRGVLALIFKTKTYKIHPPNLYTLLQIARLGMRLSVDFEKVKDNPLSESWQVISKSDDILPKIIATAILGSKWKIALFRSLLTTRLMNSLTTKQALNAVSLVVFASNPGDFLSTIKLVGIVTMTIPKNLSPVDNGG